MSKPTIVQGFLRTMFKYIDFALGYDPLQIPYIKPLRKGKEKDNK